MASHHNASEPDAEFWWQEDYRMVKCCGCDHVSFDIESVDETSIEYNPIDGSEVYVSFHRSFPVKEGLIECIENTWDFPYEVYGIYRETVTAINEGCYRLAAAGFRATVEAICKEKSIPFKNLEAKINGLKKAGIITEADRNRLHTIRFMGNDAVHQITTPSRESLLLVLDIINGVLSNLYVIDDKMRGKLECPIKTIEEFLDLLNQGLAVRSVGEIDILKKLLPENRRLIYEDRNRFETELQSKINSGEYKKLSMCPSPPKGRNQQYKIEAI